MIGRALPFGFSWNGNEAADGSTGVCGGVRFHVAVEILFGGLVIVAEWVDSNR